MSTDNQNDCVNLHDQYQQEEQRDRVVDQPDSFLTGQCSKCESEFFFAGQGKHLCHLCDSCEAAEFHKEELNLEVKVVAELVEQLQQCLDGTALAMLVQKALIEGRGLLTKWHKEGRELL